MSRVEQILELSRNRREETHKEVADLLLECEDDPQLLRAHSILRRAGIMLGAAQQAYQQTQKTADLLEPLLKAMHMIGYAEAMKDVHELLKKNEQPN